MSLLRTHVWGTVGVVASETCGRPLVGGTSRLLGVLEVMTRCLRILELAHRLSRVAVSMRMQASCSVIVSWHGWYTIEGAKVR